VLGIRGWLDQFRCCSQHAQPHHMQPYHTELLALRCPLLDQPVPASIDTYQTAWDAAGAEGLLDPGLQMTSLTGTLK